MKSAFFICIYLIIFQAQTTIAGNKKCRALVLEAGGDLGSFEAGSFKAFVENLPAEEVQYDVFTGISIGSINALGLSQFAKGQEKEQADWLLNLWQSLTQDDVYKNYQGGIIQGLLYEKGIFDNTPGFQYLAKTVSKSPQRKLSLGTCDLKTGQLIRYNENLPLSQLIEVVMASSAVPTFFPYSFYDDKFFVDGGTSGKLVDIDGAVKRCREEVDDDSDIIIDTIFVQYSKLDFWISDKKKKTFEVFSRSNIISSYATSYRELFDGKNAYPNVIFRYFIKPSSTLFNPKIPFNFNIEQMNQMINQGYNDTKNIISQYGSEGNFKEIYEESSKLLKEQLNKPLAESKSTNINEQYVKSYNKIKSSMS